MVVDTMASENGSESGLANHMKAPEAPHDAGLPANYKSKRCFFRKTWSTEGCPWDLTGTTLKQWHPLIPWNRGTKSKPSGDICKVCAIVSRLIWPVLFCLNFPSRISLYTIHLNINT